MPSSRYGLPMALYTDRAHWAVHTPTSGSAPDRRRPTQVGRAPARLGIEHILGYSPQARGRSERVNRTLQDRLANELRVAGVTTAANRYLRTHFLADFDAEFARPPILARPLSPWGASISSRSCASSTSAWSPAITSSPPVSSRSNWRNSPAAAPVPASACSCAAISTATTPSGTARGAWAGSTFTASPSAPPEPMSLTSERSGHGVKQLRSDHVSTTAGPAG